MSKERKRRSSLIVEMALEKAGIARKKCHRQLSFENIVTLSDFATNANGRRQDELNPDFTNNDTSDISNLTVHQSEICSTKNTTKQIDITLAQVSKGVDAILTDTLNTAPDLFETTAHVPLIESSTSADHGFNISLTVESGIEEPTMNDNQLEIHTQNMPFSLDSAVPSTSACASQNSNELNSIKKRNCKANIQYIDYISDQEDFSTFYGDITDSDNWSEGQEVESEDYLPAGRKKVKRKKRQTKETQDSAEIVGESANVIKRTNVRKERSKRKNSGLEYITKKGVVVQGKTVLANPCFGKKCSNDCGSVSQERRQSLFEFFWRLDKARRRDWLVSMTQKENIKRKRTNSDKRNFTIKYFINEGEGRRYVCQQFLAATLNISDKTIYSIVKNASWGCAKEDMRGKCEPPNKTKQSTIDSVQRFIKGLPAVPSHYCRQDSSKVYLSQEFKNVSNLYKLYKKHYVDQGMDIVSERIFRKVFQDNFNIGFHIPKKDKCLKCLQYEKNDNPEKQRKART